MSRWQDTAAVELACHDGQCLLSRAGLAHSNTQLVPFLGIFHLSGPTVSRFPLDSIDSAVVKVTRNSKGKVSGYEVILQFQNVPDGSEAKPDQLRLMSFVSRQPAEDMAHTINAARSSQSRALYYRMDAGWWDEMLLVLGLLAALAILTMPACDERTSVSTGGAGVICVSRRTLFGMAREFVGSGGQAVVLLAKLSEVRPFARMRYTTRSSQSTFRVFVRPPSVRRLDAPQQVSEVRETVGTQTSGTGNNRRSYPVFGVEVRTRDGESVQLRFGSKIKVPPP